MTDLHKPENSVASCDNRRTRIYLFVAQIAILIVCLEIGSFVLLAKTNLFGKYLYAPRERDWLGAEAFEEYLSQRDPILGWPTKRALQLRHSKDGSRTSPANAAMVNACLSVYGDSYAFDEEVGETEAWPNKLAGLLGCKVLNFGVGGYGLDQMYMRFSELNPSGVPALFTFVPGDYRRALTRSYGLAFGRGLGDPYSYKPRFIVEKGAPDLKKIDIPVTTFEDYRALKDPHSLDTKLPNEFFLPGSGVWSMQKLQFPYSVTALTLGKNLSERTLAVLANQDLRIGATILDTTIISSGIRRLGIDYPEHSPEAMELNRRILHGFLDRCRSERLECYILPLPYIIDFGSPLESPILESLQRDERIRVRMISMGKDCLSAEYNRRGIPEGRIREQVAPGNHYNPLTSSIIATCTLIALKKAGYGKGLGST